MLGIVAHHQQIARSIIQYRSRVCTRSHQISTNIDEIHELTKVLKYRIHCIWSAHTYLYIWQSWIWLPFQRTHTDITWHIIQQHWCSLVLYLWYKPLKHSRILVLTSIVVFAMQRSQFQVWWRHNADNYFHLEHNPMAILDYTSHTLLPVHRPGMHVHWVN